MDEEFAKVYSVEGSGLIILRNFSEPRVDFAGEINANELIEFIKEYEFPTIIEFEESTVSKILREGLDSIFLFSEEPEDLIEFEKTSDIFFG